MGDASRSSLLDQAQEVIAIMREEWDARLQEAVRALDELDAAYKPAQGDEQPIVSQGLKVREKGSGLLYTVDELGMRDVVLVAPSGERFTVAVDELERAYTLD